MKAQLKSTRELRVFLFLFFTLFAGKSLAESPAVRDRASALYYKLTGTPLMDENPLRPQIVAHVGGGNYKAAAQLITEPHTGAAHFYDTVVKLFALSFNRSHSTTNTANDLTAFIVGSVLTNKSLDEMLTGNYYFKDPFPAISGVTPYVETNDTHYMDLDNRSSFRDRLKQVTRGAADIGMFTTRGFASDFYSAGTNRRPWKGVVELLYCVPQTDIRSLVIPEDKIRRDVPRIQNGSASIYQTTCRGCHAQMDPISNAFGLWNFPNNQIVRLSSFTEKINEPNNYPTFRPTTDEWWLYTTDAQEQIFGFTDVPSYGVYPAVHFVRIDEGLRMANGDGLLSLARVFAASRGFAKCMVTRIVTQMYLKKVWNLPGMTQEDKDALASQSDVIERLTNDLMRTRTLKDTFEDAAIEYLQ